MSDVEGAVKAAPKGAAAQGALTAETTMAVKTYGRSAEELLGVVRNFIKDYRDVNERAMAQTERMKSEMNRIRPEKEQKPTEATRKAIDEFERHKSVDGKPVYNLFMDIAGSAFTKSAIPQDAYEKAANEKKILASNGALLETKLVGDLIHTIRQFEKGEYDEKLVGSISVLYAHAKDAPLNTRVVLVEITDQLKEAQEYLAKLKPSAMADARINNDRFDETFREMGNFDVIFQLLKRGIETKVLS